MNHVKINTNNSGGDFQVYVDELGQLIYAEEVKVKTSQKNPPSNNKSEEAA